MDTAQPAATAPDPQNGRLSWFTRISYGLGDTAMNIVAGAMTILTFFYTDYAGVEPTTVGLVFLLSRIFDGVSDLIMGFVVERTNSKWGKSRPWILWSSIPFCISIVLIYTVPQGSDFMKFVYLFITYNFCNTVCYTALNLPYGSLSAMMTRISRERDMLSITRMALSPIGKIISISATLPLIKVLGDNQAAWIKVMSIWAVLAFVLLMLCFSQCKETVVIKARKKVSKVPVVKSLKCLFGNKYFWMAMTIWMMQCIIQMVTGTVLPYYCKYIFHDDSLFSILLLCEVITTIVCTILFCPSLLKRFGKRNMSLIGVVVALVGHLIYCLNPTSFSWVVFSCIIRGIGFAPLELGHLRLPRRRRRVRPVEIPCPSGRSDFLRWFCRLQSRHWHHRRIHHCPDVLVWLHLFLDGRCRPAAVRYRHDCEHVHVRHDHHLGHLAHCPALLSAR